MAESSLRQKKNWRSRREEKGEGEQRESREDREKNLPGPKERPATRECAFTNAKKDVSQDGEGDVDQPWQVPHNTSRRSSAAPSQMLQLQALPSWLLRGDHHRRVDDPPTLLASCHQTCQPPSDGDLRTWGPHALTCGEASAAFAPVSISSPSFSYASPRKATERHSVPISWSV